MHFYKVKTSNYRGLIVSLLVFALIAGGIVALLNQTQQRSNDEQVNLLKDALRRAAISCYAVEGRYPESIDYMVKNYGIIINEDRFIVRYDAFGENIMPDIAVFEVGKEQVDQDDEFSYE